jgi:hypothetical protein
LNVLLAGAIGAGAAPFAPFEWALASIRLPWTVISQKMLDFSPTIADRLSSTDQDTSNIFHWGSPCFFQ